MKRIEIKPESSKPEQVIKDATCVLCRNVIGNSDALVLLQIGDPAHLILPLHMPCARSFKKTLSSSTEI